MTTSSRGIPLEQLGQDLTGLGASGEPSTSVKNTLDASASTASQAQGLYGLLDRLGKVFSSAPPLEEMLYSVVTLTRQAMKADLCLIMLADETSGDLALQSSSPDLNLYGVSVPSLHIGHTIWEKLHDFHTRGQLPVLNRHEQEQLNPLKHVRYETLLVVPLVAGTHCIGVTYCYFSKPRDYTVEDQVVLQTITNQASLAIQNRQLAHALDYGNSVKAFFDDLLSDRAHLEEALQRKATFLGCDLAVPHAMCMLEISPSNKSSDQRETTPEENWHSKYRSLVQLVRHHIQESYPSSLLDERDNILYGLLSLRKDDTEANVKVWFSELVRQVQRERYVHVFVGISTPYSNLNDYRRGFAEAEEALRIGQCLHREANSTAFNDLGAYRYIYPFARTMASPATTYPRDSYLEKIEALVRHDQRYKRSELLKTLDTFLEHDGSIKATSEILHVHRNTMLIRLKHIEELCSMDLSQYSTRFVLQSAIMVYKLRTGA